MTRRLFIDLDGVLADFDGAFAPLFGFDHREASDEVMWEAINNHGSYFRNLPPCAGALEFFDSMRRYDPPILTACPPSRYADVAGQKRAWVREHLGLSVTVLPTAGGKAKPMFMHSPGDVLVDDFAKNCIAWQEAGGIAVHHSGDFAITRNCLAALGFRA